MKIQAINFKMPVTKSNVSFGIGHVVGGYKSEKDAFVRNLPKIDPEKKFKGRQIQADSLNVLSWANSKQQEAKRMYAQAKKINRTWQKEKPVMLVDRNQIDKKYFTHAGKLEQYIETRPDGSKLIIGYFNEKPYSITQVDEDGNENIYIFYDDGKLAEFTEGRSEEMISHKHIVTKEGIYSYSNGYLSTYVKNQQTINHFGEFSKGQKDVLADVKMHFDVAGKKPYLKKAETKTGTSNEAVIAPEDTLIYNKNGELLEAR